MSRETLAGAAFLGLIGVVLPLLGLAPFAIAPIYLVNSVGQILCFVLLAMSVDLMWGGVGVLSLGHGHYFALGGYLMAMHLLRTAYALTGVLPDFLNFMGQSAFPAWWRGPGLRRRREARRRVADRHSRTHVPD